MLVGNLGDHEGVLRSWAAFVTTPPKGFDGIVLLVFLGVPSPFFRGILLSSKPPKTQGKRPVFGKNDG